MPLKRYLFLLLIVLLPADGTDQLRVTIRGVGVSALDLLLVAILYLDLLEGALAGFGSPRFARRLGWLAVAATCLSAVSLLYISPYRMSADVKVTLNLAQLAVTCYLAARTFGSRPQLSSGVRALLAAVSIVALATVLKSLGLDVPGDVRTAARPVGPLTLGVAGLTQIPGPISLVLLAAFPAAVLPVVVARRAIRLPLAVLLATAAVVTFSRTLWLALAVQVLVLLAGEALAAPRTQRRLAAGLGLGLAVAVLASAGPRLFQLLVGLRPTTVSGRLAGFANAFELATSSPLTFLFGAGKGTFRLWTGAGTVPHNALLDLLVAKGVLAVLVFLGLQLWLMARLWRLTRSAGAHAGLARMFFTSLAGLLAYGLASPTMTSLVLWVVIGLAAALVCLAEAEAPLREQPPTTP